MNRLRIVVHAAVLALSNLAAVTAGFFVWYYARGAAGPQIPTQLLSAVALNLLGFGVWFLLAHRTRWGGLRLASDFDLLAVWFLAIPIGAVIFVPTHYLAEGYLTAGGNLVALGLYAAAVNLPILAICARLGRWRRQAEVA